MVVDIQEAAYQKVFTEKPCDHIHEVIYRFHLSRAIFNVSFQLIPYQGICC